MAAEKDKAVKPPEKASDAPEPKKTTDADSAPQTPPQPPDPNIPKGTEGMEADRQAENAQQTAETIAKQGALSDGEAGKAEAQKQAAEQPPTPPEQPVMLSVDAKELVSNLMDKLGVSAKLEPAKPEPKTLGLDFAPMGGIFKLEQDGELVNSWGELVDEDGEPIEQRQPRRRAA